MNRPKKREGRAFPLYLNGLPLIQQIKPNFDTLLDGFFSPKHGILCDHSLK